MNLVFRPHKCIIEKAKKRPAWHKTRTPKRSEALAQSMAESVTVHLVKGIKAFRKTIPDKEALYQAYLNGGWDGMYREIPWHTMEGHFDSYADEMLKLLPSVAALGMEYIPPHAQKNLRYDYENPHIQRVFDNRAGKLIVDIKQDTREAINSITHRQFTQALSPKDMASEIKDSIGLYPRLARAHENYVSGLKDKELPETKVNELSEEYYDKLLTYRATTIARSESQFMLNHGQLQVWKQASNDGLIPAESTKVWVMDGNPCEDCANMDGEEVGINDMWIMDDGTACDVPSDSHPNCNCVMTLNMTPEHEGEEDE